MTCVFCQIVSGALPAEVVYRDDEVVAFLDARPIFAGHTLIVPTAHLVTLADLPPEMLAPFLSLVQTVTRAVESALGAEGSFVGNNNRVSQSVPHLHVHVVPRRKKDGLRGFFWPRQRYADDADRERVRASLEAAIAADYPARRARE